ncbi:hypothetical protein Cantr_04136 [Candida viswanathii]|uniref:Gag1-like clamp domain-containing protein n=1 Tax=Candida viswanathii TaxID=5486 RepID=A0A367XQ15_9ASCO|nr:hypothetical protein Cantr_04136 [Candida viswanathii]
MISETQSINNLRTSTNTTTTANTNTVANYSITNKQQLLRKAKSTPRLRSTTKTTTTTTPPSATVPHANKKHKKQSSSGISSLFKKFSNFLSKVKNISDDVLNHPDDYDLFIEYPMPSSTATPTEDKFLQDYKKYKSLDLMVEHYNNKQQTTTTTTTTISTPNNEVKSSSTMTSTLQDFMRQQPHQDILPASDEFLIDDIPDDDGESTAAGEVMFNDIDVIELRKEFESWVNTKNTTDTDSKSTLLSQSNIGSNLWEYRRSKWLQCNDPNKLNDRLKQTSISYIPKDSYVQIYSSLVDKNKILKDDKHINLLDLLKIINAGWIAEDKWERAARGLP